MAVRYDYKFEEDLVFENGDFSVVESDKDHIKDTINSDLNWWKENPIDGVAISNYSNSAGEIEKLSRKIKIEIESDGYKVNNPVIFFDDNGNLKIYPNASII
jgi:hypothetical protein